MSVPRRPWQPREAPATTRSRLAAISKGTGIAALVLFVVTGATVAGIVGSNQHHGVTPAAAAGLPSSSSSAGTLAAGSSTSTVSSASAAGSSPSTGGVVLAIAQPRSQGQPGIIPVPLVPRATAGPIPLLAWEAYHRAAAGSGCKLPWYVLAGIGKIESNHGRYGGAQFDATGTVHPSIFGPPTAYGRAMGPMQFIPPTWATYAADGNNDDITNPQNIFDATKAAAHYLCTAGGPDLSGLAAQRRAVFAYNHLASYVADVLAFASAYQHSEPETVVHLVPIVYPSTAKAASASAARTTASAHDSATATSTRPGSTATSTGRTSTSASASTTGTSASVPPTTTCMTTSPTPSTSATPTSAPSTNANKLSSASSAGKAGSVAPTRTAAAVSSSSTASSTTSSPTLPTCPPCPTATPTPTPTSTSSGTASTSPSSTASTCPTVTPTPTTTAPSARGTARLTATS